MGENRQMCFICFIQDESPDDQIDLLVQLARAHEIRVPLARMLVLGLCHQHAFVFATLYVGRTHLILPRWTLHPDSGHSDPAS